MRDCMQCGGDEGANIALDDTIDVCGHTFTAEVPAVRCRACGEIVVQASDVRRFERRVAVELAKAGPRTGESFAFLRKAFGATEAQLAHLLDVPAEFIGFWERGEWPMDPRAFAVLASLTLARHDGQALALDCLGVLRAPRALAPRVRLELDPRRGAAPFQPSAAHARA